MVCIQILAASASLPTTCGRRSDRWSLSLTELESAANFKGCLRLRYTLIDAARHIRRVDLEFLDLQYWTDDMALPATQIRRGMVLVFEGDPCRVVEFRHHTPGNLRAMVQAKMKNLRTGSSFEHRFRAADSIEQASMETHDLEYLYDAGGTYHFMNTEN